MESPVDQIVEEIAASTDDVPRGGLLVVLARKICESEPARALLCAEQALAIATAHADRSLEAQSHLAIAICNDSLSDYSAALEHARMSEQIYRELGDDGGRANALNTTGIAARGMSDYPTALASFREALAIFTRRGDESRMAAAYNNIGVALSSIGSLADALEAYLAALRLYEKIGEELVAAITTSNIAIIYYYLGDNDQSFDFHSRSLSYFRSREMGHDMALALGNISSIYKQRGEIDAAMTAISEALEIFQRLGEKRYEATTRIKLGMLQELCGDTKKALEQMREAAKIARSIGNLETYGDAQHRIGELHRRLGRHSQALAALNKGLQVAIETGMVKPEADLHRSLADTYHAAGDFARAFEHLVKCSELREAIIGEERQRAVAEMQARFDVERVEREREIFRLKSEHLEASMEQRAKELAALAMHLVQKNTFLEKLRRDATRLADANPGARDAFAELNRSIASNLHDDNDWDRFEKEFQLVHRDFLQSLARQYPRLTPTELKICALLKINLSNKDITRLLSVSLRNVESHRYAIRRKLGLPGDVNLSAYLAGLG